MRMIDYKAKIQELHQCGCPHFSECMKDVCYGRQKGSDITYKFRFDRARVGEEYGKDDSVPKIVMVGIEGFSDEKEISKVIAPSLTADNPHYNGVKYILAYLLADFLQKDRPAAIITKSCVRWIEDALKRYCLCNLYRCAFVPTSDEKRTKNLCHTDAMKAHCISRLIAEIKALDAEIVVIQTTNGNDFPEKNREAICTAFQCEAMIEEGKCARLYRGQNNGHGILILQTYHGAYGGFKSYEYLNEKLNPLLDEAIKEYRSFSATSQP